MCVYIYIDMYTCLSVFLSPSLYAYLEGCVCVCVRVCFWALAYKHIGYRCGLTGPSVGSIQYVLRGYLVVVLRNPVTLHML